MHLSLKELGKGLGVGGKTPPKSTSRQRRIMGERGRNLQKERRKIQWNGTWGKTTLLQIHKTFSGAKIATG